MPRYPRSRRDAVEDESLGPRPQPFEIWRNPAWWGLRDDANRGLAAYCDRDIHLAAVCLKVAAGEAPAALPLAIALKRRDAPDDVVGTALYLGWTNTTHTDAAASERVACLVAALGFVSRRHRWAQPTSDWYASEEDEVHWRTLNERVRAYGRVLIRLRRLLQDQLDLVGWEELPAHVADTLLRAVPPKPAAPSKKLDERRADPAPLGEADLKGSAPMAETGAAGAHLVVAPGAEEAVRGLRDGRWSGLRTLSQPMPLVSLPDAFTTSRRLAQVAAEAPNAERIINRIRADLALLRTAGRSHVSVPRPILIVGPPGCGKSRFAARLAWALGLPIARLDMTLTDIVGLGGSSRSWSNTAPSWPVEQLANLKVANPLLLVDEVGRGVWHSGGRAEDALLPMLEPASARVFGDPLLGTCDISRITWVLTTNPDSRGRIPAAVLSRCRIYEMETLPVHAFGDILRTMLSDIAREHGLERPEMLPRIEPEERVWLASTWQRSGGNARMLAKAVERVLGDAAEREEMDRGQLN